MSLVILVGGAERLLLLESSVIRGLDCLALGLTAGILHQHLSSWWVWMSVCFQLRGEVDTTVEKEQAKQLHKPFNFSLPACLGFISLSETRAILLTLQMGCGPGLPSFCHTAHAHAWVRPLSTQVKTAGISSQAALLFTSCCMCTCFPTGASCPSFPFPQPPLGAWQAVLQLNTHPSVTGIPFRPATMDY